MAANQYYGDLANTASADKYFTFWLNGQQFAVPIGNVVQIVGLPPLTPIPEAPYYMKGIMNIRGALIPTIDLRAKFSMEETEHDERTSVIIINVQDKQISIIVDDVSEVANIPRDEYARDESAVNGYMSEYITHLSIHNKRIIIHLDPVKLFADDVLQYV